MFVAIYCTQLVALKGYLGNFSCCQVHKNFFVLDHVFPVYVVSTAEEENSGGKTRLNAF